MHVVCIDMYYRMYLSNIFIFFCLSNFIMFKDFVNLILKDEVKISNVHFLLTQDFLKNQKKEKKI